MTPDDARNAILDAALRDAPFEGWTDVMLAGAVRSAGLPDGAAALYFPGGAIDVIVFWSERMDVRAREKIEALDLASMKIRERVTQGVVLRLSETGRHEDAARRAQARLRLPDGLGTGSRLTWNAADMIWRAIGDTSTDGNFYSKRAVLSAVLASTAPIWLGDALPNKPKARRFLNRRIENVMQFETLKAQFRKATADIPNPAEILGRLRYGRPRGGVPTRRRKRRIRRGA
ncbi:COQ9 family protein [uncultured Algimonas sp.]|uniref:COQ9 family protein n=1 Tax=uncultured Algimonas sp. TaxID=1547920 RepID=UPI002618DDD3|nr:COQ9 family protein [uncultured Algimonas sp.]